MIFHEFTLSDVEDPDIYVAQPLYNWQTTEMGSWVMQHCTNPTYRIMVDPNTLGYKVTIYGDLTTKDATYFTLKYK
jgi:hypothetical protein